MKSVDTIRSILSRKGRELWSVAPTATVYEAIEKMSDKGVGALLVMSGGQLLGIISERDYARKVILKERSSKQTLVREIMTSSVITATPGDNVEDCMRTMTENRIRHLPVVDGGDFRVVGIVSIGDLVNWIITAHEETIGHLQSYIAGNYPG
jgi:CBS domain-containing protein